MSTVEMQNQVGNAYPGWKWKQKVNKMAANQVQVIWFRLRALGKV